MLIFLVRSNYHIITGDQIICLLIILKYTREYYSVLYIYELFCTGAHGQTYPRRYFTPSIGIILYMPFLSVGTPAG